MTPRIRTIPGILFRLFLGLSAAVLAGAGYLAIATRFWTAPDSEMDEANKIISHRGPIPIFCLMFAVGVGAATARVARTSDSIDDKSRAP